MIPEFKTHNEAIAYTREHPECLSELMERYEKNKVFAIGQMKLGNIKEAMRLMSLCDADRNGIIYANEKHPMEKQ